ncbi:helix-turn-helix transcriptional regulator [Streptomyces piniterrae]|uniref:Helix-turn-helix transcriptional regulator n=1 Tax=Streptomyces piniterrae TaxID=2571125 RepID=A0A4U0NFV6_9ACTN|nr:helix-turn-helix transcriptional regulator [Streptomyces piniterrae]TJZ53025.1 helix-turn-helix transcriptional regulator [Streptomyces piniterrae]
MPYDGYYDNIPVSLRILGLQMKALRELAGLTQHGLADKVGFSESLISSVECGRRPLKEDLALKLEEAFKVPGVFMSVIEEQLKEPHPSWFQPYADAEAEAVALSAYGTHLVKGLLQTEAYARAVHIDYHPALDDDEIERRVTARLSRQKLLSRVPTASLSFILEEVVLRRPIGGPEVLREQLHHLLEIGRMRHVQIQVMPTNRTSHAGLAGPFTLVEPPDREMCAYLEVQNVGQLVTARRAVSAMARRYGILQSQALNAEESAEFIQKLAMEDQ